MRVFLALVLILGLSGCIKPPRREVGSVEDLGYPSCGEDALPAGELVAEGYLRSGPMMREEDVVERFEVRRRDCVTVVQAHQEWALGTSDLDVVYDEALLPLRVWKRTTAPSAADPIATIETRRFELRGDRTTMTGRSRDGRRRHFVLRGGRPQAVVGPGRGLLTAWFQRADLGVGGRERVPVLDVREPIERIREVTLQRLADDEVEGRGRVRVYTIYGREPVFADDDNVVVGDMYGLRPDAVLDTPAPAPLPTAGPVDPIHTP
ncbi:MAG: hypothetical protein ACFCGT_20840 [Sandaracinaceae bacterium]